MKIWILIGALLLSTLSVSAANAQAIYNTACPGTGCLDISVNNQGALGIQITGTWVGTITFSSSVGTSSTSTFTNLLVTNSTTLENDTAVTTNGIWLVSVAGLGRVRVAFTSYTSGTANIAFRAVSPARSSLSAVLEASIGDITVSSSALPTGASTAALQTTSNTLLTNLTASLGSATGGISSANSILGGCIYNTVQPTLINGQQVGLQCDASGNLRMSASIALSGDVNVISSALPTGAATAVNQTTQITNQTTGNNSLANLTTPVGSKTGGTAGTNSYLMGGVYNTTPPTLTNGQQAAAQFTSAGALITTATFTPSSTSGCYLVSAATNNATNCKASPGSLYGFRIINTTATIYYLRLYNLASTPTCSSATGFIESIPIPASADGNGIVWVTQNPIAYSTGIGFCFTSGSASTNNGAAATGVFGAIQYN